MDTQLFFLPEVTTALEFIQSIKLPDIDDPAAAGRRFYEGFIPMAGEPESIYCIREYVINAPGRDINIKVYRPSALPALPVVLYLHGGWFNAGNPATHEQPVRAMANLSEAVIVSVDYRLAPEHPFPAGLDDCRYVLEWIVANASLLGIDAGRIALAGDSAGGALAAVVTRWAIKEMNINIACQVLIYPVTDAALDTASWKRFANGPNLTLAGAHDAWNQYVPEPLDRNSPDASPLRAVELSGLPPALIVTAELDPLHDEAILYAKRLEAGGVAVQLSEYQGMIHGFFQMGAIISDGKRAIEEVATFLANHLKY